MLDEKSRFLVREFCRRQAPAEVANNFRTLKLVDCSAAKAYLRLMELRTEPGRRELSEIFVDRFYPIDSRDKAPTNEDVVRQFSRLNLEILASSTQLSEAVNSRASKSRLRGELLDKLKVICGSRPTNTRGGGYCICAETNRYLVETHIDFGSSIRPLECHHNIKPLGDGVQWDHVSLLAILGISSQTYWDKIDVEHIDKAVEAAVTLVAWFLERVDQL
jgi:hypothetical protein